MFTALLATVLLQKSIDFDHKGAPVERVVEAMSEAYGEKMSADGTMSHDYIILALRDATAERARELIAEALNASWIKIDDALILHRSRDQEREDEQKELDAKIRLIESAQNSIKINERLAGKKADDLIKRFLENSGRSFDYAEETEIRNSLPPTRLLARFMKETDAEFFAQLPESGRVAFSVAGAFGVETLPSSARSLVQEFVTDQNALASLREARAANINSMWGMQHISPRIEDVRIVVTSTPGNMTAHVTAPMIQGTRYVWANLRATADRELLTYSTSWVTGAQDELDSPEISKEWIKLRAPFGANPATRTLPSERLLNVFLEHDQHDVFELTKSDVVIQAANTTGRSVIFVPYQNSLEKRLSRFAEPKFNDAVEAVLRPFSETTVYDDAILILPMSPILTRASYWDRQKFAQALKAFRDRNSNTLDPLASAVASSDRRQTSGILSAISMLGRTIRTDSGGIAYDLLFFYGKMNARRKLQATIGGALYRLGDLGKEQAEIVMSLMGMQMMSGPSGVFPSNSLADRSASAQKLQNAPLLRDLSLGDVMIKVEAVRMTSMFWKREGSGNNPARTMSLDKLASLAAQAKQKGEPYFNSQQLFRIVDEQAVIMSLVTNETEIRLESFYVPAVFEDDTFVTFDKLPQPFLEQFEKLIDPPN